MSPTQRQPVFPVLCLLKDKWITGCSCSTPCFMIVTSGQQLIETDTQGALYLFYSLKVLHCKSISQLILLDPYCWIFRFRVSNIVIVNYFSCTCGFACVCLTSRKFSGVLLARSLDTCLVLLSKLPKMRVISIVFLNCHHKSSDGSSDIQDLRLWPLSV